MKPLQKKLTPKEVESWEERFEKLVFYESEDGFAGLNYKIKEVNAEHLGDVKSKLIPEIKRFIRQELSQTKSSTRRETLEKIKREIGDLRQWLNEDRITDPKKMVTNEQIEYWLSILDNK